ncbi:MAG TPA: ATP synthase F0 subunit B [Terriglobales bacterium]|nr:ATP synthase F0 subunit B [Terriglobales bacterium]
MRFLLGVLSYVLLLTWVSVAGVVAQQSPARTAAHRSTAATPAPSSTANRAFAPPNANSNQELTHASNEAAGRTAGEAGVDTGSASHEEPEDEEAAFKYSAAVRGISRITHLSLVGAYWLCVLINFAVIAVLIVWALKSNLPAMFRGRTQEIQRGMEEARRASEEAKHQLQEIEARLSRMNVDISEMQKHAENDSKAEEIRLRASIEEEKHKIVESAQHEVEQATSAARRELQKYAVGLAIAMAEKGIRVDVDEDKLLVEDFSEQLTSQTRTNGGS